MGSLREAYGVGYIKNAKQHQSVNYSSILTKLIQDVGRLCDNYASDLFIDWQHEIVQPLEKGELISQIYIMKWYLYPPHLKWGPRQSRSVT